MQILWRFGTEGSVSSGNAKFKRKERENKASQVRRSGESASPALLAQPARSFRVYFHNPENCVLSTVKILYRVLVKCCSQCGNILETKQMRGRQESFACNCTPSCPLSEGPLVPEGPRAQRRSETPAQLETLRFLGLRDREPEHHPSPLKRRANVLCLPLAHHKLLLIGQCKEPPLAAERTHLSNVVHIHDRVAVHALEL
jgi:hypothetical protein